MGSEAFMDIYRMLFGAGLNLGPMPLILQTHYFLFFMSPFFFFKYQPTWTNSELLLTGSKHTYEI